MSDATSYTLIQDPSPNDKPTVQEFKDLLEKGKDEAKVETMRRVLICMLNGDPLPALLMHIIRFVMPSRNKELKKMLHFYWEICPKLQPDGKLKQEMILVCNAIRNDLQHPNEYIRGATLRFLCKLKETELLEPLVPAVRQCLDHRHAYVRKNAFFAVMSIAQHSEHLIPDASEVIATYLEEETDATCKRNAFVSLAQLDRNLAFAYIRANYADASQFDELLQLAFIDFMRRDAVQHPDLRPAYLKILTEILEAMPSMTVLYETSLVLTKLSNSPAVVVAAASKYIEIAVKEPDNNVKLIVLEKLDKLRIENPGVLNDLTMDILMVLSSPDLDVRKIALNMALEMLSSKNADEVIKLLKKELKKSVEATGADNQEYRQLLIQAIHSCAIKFNEVAASVIDLLLDFLGEFNANSALDVISLVKDAVEIYPDLRPAVIKKLIATLGSVSSSRVYRNCLWVLGEYCLTLDDIQEAWAHIRKSIGQVPILSSELNKQQALEGAQGEEEGGAENGSAAVAASKKPKVLADGTYASESAFTAKQVTSDLSETPLRSLILEGRFFVAAVLASTITKLVLRYFTLSDNVAHKNALRAEAMLILTSVLRVGESDIVTEKIDEDSVDRIVGCIRVLADKSAEAADDASEKVVAKSFLEDSRAAFKKLVDAKEKKLAEAAAEKSHNTTEIDKNILFRQFAKIQEASGTQADDLAGDIDNATGSVSKANDRVVSKLSKIVQLTGYSDPVYAEAYITVHQFDIVLDVLLFNQTYDTLQNLSVEFATLGDLKVVERPTTQNMGPQTFHSIQTTIKVISADAGVIFGNIVYEGNTAGVNSTIILNDVHTDIMDYIKPGKFSETEFRAKWTEFEWENKVNIATTWSASLQSFLKFILDNTNMSCLTPNALDEDDCRFLSANLHARTTFGEDALANISIERDGNNKISGHFRIRAKGQGLALSLGDRVAELQRKN